jgi:NADH pyrophosphatase NudC (nudix superfamily)
MPYIDVSKIKFNGETYTDEENEVYIRLSDVKQAIEQTPKEDVVEVKHGEWKINSDGYYPYCSNCKAEPKNKEMTRYCAECGALMDGEE